MNTKYFLSIVVLLGFTLLMSTAFVAPQGNEPWPVPEKYEKMKNPVSADAESLSVGKALYIKHCKSCHGTKGLGDGTKAAQLETLCGNFTVAKFQEESDGAIFYKINEGRGDMPSFKKKIPVDEDIWSLVNYLRKFK